MNTAKDSIAHSSLSIKQTYISICSGIGGLDKGAEFLEPVMAYEINRDACDMFPKITGSNKIEQLDLTQSDFNKLPDANGIIGGVPCQEFSDAGRNAGSEGKRNLFPQALNLVCLKHPDWFVFENVPGLTKGKHAAYFEYILNELSAMGYRVSWRILCAADYGVPQKRKRVFIVGHTSKNWVWPQATHFQYGAFGLPRWESWDNALKDWVKTALPDKLPHWILKKYATLTMFPDQSLPHDGYFAGENLRESRYEIPAGEPACTVTVGAHHKRRVMVNDIVYGGDEDSAAILQCLPPGIGLTHSMIGNAVPPPMSRAIFNAMFPKQESE